MSAFINGLALAIHDEQRFQQMIAIVKFYHFELLDLTAIKLKLGGILLRSSLEPSLTIELCHELLNHFSSLKDEFTVNIQDASQMLHQVIGQLELKQGTVQHEIEGTIQHEIEGTVQHEIDAMSLDSSESLSDFDTSDTSLGKKRQASPSNFRPNKRQRLEQNDPDDTKPIIKKELNTLIKKEKYQQDEEEILEFFIEKNFDRTEIENVVEHNTAAWMALSFIKENFSLFVSDFKFTEEELLSIAKKPGSTARFEALRDHYFIFKVLGATNENITQFARYCPQNTLKFLGENFSKFIMQGIRPRKIIPLLCKNDAIKKLHHTLNSNLYDFPNMNLKFLKSFALEAYILDRRELILSLPVIAYVADFYKMMHYLNYLSQKLQQDYQVCTDHFTFKIPQSYWIYLKYYLNDPIQHINFTDLDNILTDAKVYKRSETATKGLTINCETAAQAYFTEKRLHFIKTMVQFSMVSIYRRAPLANFSIKHGAKHSLHIDDGNALLAILEQRDFLQELIDPQEGHSYWHLREEIFQNNFRDNPLHKNSFHFFSSSGKDEAEEYVCSAPSL